MEREELVARLRELKDYVNQSWATVTYYGMDQATLDLWADRRDALEEAIEVVQVLSKKPHSI